MQSCCATHISVERLLNRRLKKTSVVEGSVVHNFSLLLRSQLEEIELSIWQVKTCCLRWYGRWQLIRRLPWHLEGAERVCCRQPIHNCFRCCVLAIILDTAQQVILQGYCEAIINAPGTGTSNLLQILHTDGATLCYVEENQSQGTRESRRCSGNLC